MRLFPAAVFFRNGSAGHQLNAGRAQVMVFLGFRMGMSNFFYVFKEIGSGIHLPANFAPLQWKLADNFTLD